MRRWLLILIFAFSCRIDLPTKSGQERAINVVWIQQFGMVDLPPPIVMWINPAQLDCGDGQGWAVLPSVNPMECVSGLFYGQFNQAFVAWPDGTQNISDTSLAHELCHAWSWYHLGNEDGDHTGSCFKVGGYVQIANEALALVGL